jgi:hypothetical protein
MRTLLKTPLAILTLALLLLPEALFLHRCGCGKIVDCCCRAMARAGASCPARSARLGAPHCSGGAGSRPSTLQNRQEPVERWATARAWRPATALNVAGWAAAAPRDRGAGLPPEPGLPPPRRLLSA